MSDSRMHLVADAILDALEAASTTLDCTWSVNDCPELILENIDPDAGLVGYIVPDGWSEELLNRVNATCEVGIWLVVAQKLADTVDAREAGATATTIRSLALFVEQVRDALCGQRITLDGGATARWIRAGHMRGGNERLPWMAKDKWHEKGLFISSVYLVYSVDS